MLRHCVCIDPCFDQAFQCVGCDKEGYPVRAKRRLECQKPGSVIDIDDGTRFACKKVKGGTRLVPVFERVDWKSANGFYALQIILSCLGGEGEYVLWDEAAGVAMTENGWVRKGFVAKSKPAIKHTSCGGMITTTAILKLQSGRGAGCPNCVAMLQKWSGRYSEFVALLPTGYTLQLNEDQWKAQCDGCDFCPPIRCETHSVTVTTSSIKQIKLANGRGGVGCPMCIPKLNPWVGRYADFVTLLPKGYTILLDKEAWLDQCSGAFFCPPIRCEQHGTIVTTTTVHTIAQGHGVGCRACVPSLNLWCNRYDEFLTMLPIGYTLQLTAEEWKVECNGDEYCPPILCEKHGTVVTTTTIGNIKQTKGSGIGCPGCCGRKTEAKVKEWLGSQEEVAAVTQQFHGPDRTRFDFHIRFSDGFELFVEVDGPQHFWPNVYHFSEEGCKRDLEKEEWAVSRGYSVVRVLQDDIWNDRYGWDTWLLESFKKARLQPTRIFIPVHTPEYSSTDSMYYRLRLAKVAKFC